MSPDFIASGGACMLVWLGFMVGVGVSRVAYLAWNKATRPERIWRDDNDYHFPGEFYE